MPLLAPRRAPELTPEPARLPTPAELRPRLFDDDDPVFLGLLAGFTVAAAAFLAWVTVMPMPEQDTLVRIEEAERMLTLRPHVLIPTPPRDAHERSASPDAPPLPTPPAKVRPAPAGPPQTPPDAGSVTDKSLLLQALATRGLVGTEGWRDLLEDGATTTMLDDAVQHVQGPQAASRDTLGQREGRRLEDAGVPLSIIPEGHGGPVVARLKVSIQTEPAEVAAETGEAADISPVVRRYRGRIEACAQAALRENPKLDGRVVGAWQITRGRVSDVHISGTTHSETLESCVGQAVRGFRFAEDLTATVDAYPWIVSGG